MPGGSAPLPTVAAAVSGGLLSSAALTSAMVAGPAQPDLRLPTIKLAPTAPAIAIDEASMLRHRFTGNSMMEFYPVAGSGFHLSGGSRLYSRRNFNKETEDSAHGALAVTRVTGGSPIMSKSSFRKFNPAMTAGYSLVLSKVAQIGLEGGAMMGHLFAAAPGLPHHAFGYRTDNGLRPNAVANLVFGLHF